MRMKAFVLEKYSKSSRLRETDLPDPTPGDSDVLIEIAAAGLNQLDLRVRNGAFKQFLPYRPPFVLGHDLAGTVIAVGPDVRKFGVGDEVYSRPRDGRIGTFAQRLAVHEDDVALKPGNLSMTDAAGLPLVTLTAWQVLVEIGNVTPGQKVLIQAGTGGVGSIAIQLAKHLGATVATTCSASHADMVRELGADIVIDYKTQDIQEELSELDPVLHSQDAATLEKSLKVLTPGGKLISISGPPDPEFAISKGLNLAVRTALAQMSRGARSLARKLGVHYSFHFMRADGAQLTEITKLVEDNVIVPVTDVTFPFSDINVALDRLGEGRAKGKIVVDMP